MSKFDLEITLSNLDFLIEQETKRIRIKEYASDSFLFLSACYRRKGCGHFLLTLDGDMFFNELYKSAIIYDKLLTISQTHSLDSYYLCRSRGLPMLDAIAIRKFPLAERIATNMTPDFQEGMEYEEDFHFFNVISLLASHTLEKKQVFKSMQEFEKSLDGDDTSRFLVLKSFFDRNDAGFEANFYNLIGEWEGEIKRKKKSGKLDPHEGQTEANIFVEGLALIRLAEKTGMKIEKQYVYIPDILIEKTNHVFPEDVLTI